MRADYEACTVLALGARGRLDGAPFTLDARTCIRGRKGALWNEWTVRCDDGRVRFLAEVAGTFTIYEERSLVPPLADVAVGGPLDTGYVVVERGEAVRVAQWGAVEDAPASYAYVDLSGRGGEPATIDYGSVPPRVFVGQRVTLASLGLAAHADGLRLVRVPEASRPKGVEAWLVPGDAGELDGLRVRVLGSISRSTGPSEAQRVRWDEFLLVDGAGRLRWLVVSDGHWGLVEAVEAGRVREGEGEANVVFDGITYELLSEGVARVDWASGELPWQVSIGETSNVRDFVRPPWILTREWTESELAWSRATYVEPEVIARAFGKRPLPRPAGRAPNAT